MSMSITLSPLHTMPDDDLRSWAGNARSRHGVPATATPAQALPTVTDVLAALRVAGCRGTAQFTVLGMDVSAWLPPSSAGSADPNDVGETLLLPAIGQPALTPDRPVALVSFSYWRSGLAVLRALCALTPTAGPLLAYDDSARDLFVARPGERAEELAPHWPWLNGYPD